MTEQIKKKANEVITNIQGGKIWDEEAKLSNMITILEETAKITKKTIEKKLIVSMLLILKTMEENNFDLYNSELTYVLPGVEKFSFEFKGFSFDAILTFITRFGNKKDNHEHRSYKFVYIDDKQKSLGALVEKFSRKKCWREVKNSLYKQAVTA